MKTRNENVPGDPGAAVQVSPKLAPDAARSYEVICISTYAADLEELDRRVAELKARGFRRANRSWLIRIAIARLDLASITAPGHQ